MTKPPDGTLSHYLLCISLVASLVCSCEDPLYVSFLLPEKNGELREVRSGVEVRLRLAAESLLENELSIINKSKDTVYMNPREFFFAVGGRDIKIPVEEDYDTYLMRMNSKIASVCEGTKFSYKCVDVISNLNNRFRGKGFTFDAIQPGKARKGYIAFNFPTPLNDSPSKKPLMKEWANHYETLRGSIIIGLVVGEEVETFMLPAEIELYDDPEKAPSELQSMVK